MANPTITTVDLGGVVYDDPVFEDAVVTFGAEDTFPEGTLFGRVSGVPAAGVIVGTGAKTIVIVARAGRSLKPGSYVLTVGNVTAGVGPASMADPDGLTESVTLAVSGAHEFPNLGITMTITAGGTELDDGATVTFVVTAGTKFVPFAVAGSNGAQLPRAVYVGAALYKASSGDLATRLLIGGKVRKERLIVDAAGDDSTLTAAHIEALRDYGINALSVRDLAVLDNAT